MPDSKIYITISSTESGSKQTANKQETTGGNSKPTANQNVVVDAGELNAVYDGVKTMMVDAGKKTLMNAISQYGNLTGNAVQASKLQAFTNIAGYALAIKAGGLVGLAATAVDIGIKVFNSTIEIRKANAQVEMLRQRAGNATLNGSREYYD